MTWPYIAIGILAVLNAFMGFFVFARAHSRSSARAFFAFSLGIAILAGSMVLLEDTHHMFFDRTLFAGGYLMMFGLVWLSMAFPEDARILGRRWWLFVPLAALAALTPFGFVIRRVAFGPGGSLRPVNGPGMGIFAAVIAGYALFAVVSFVRRYRRSSGTARLQMQYLGAGAGIFLGAMTFFDVILPAFDVFSPNLIGPLASVAFTACAAYAILRHRLMDIRVVVQRGTIYVALAVAVSGFYLVAALVVAKILHDRIDAGDQMFFVASVVTVCVGLLTAPSIERWLRRATDKIFFKGRYKYPQALRALSAVLNANIETGKILDDSARALEGVLRAEQARFVLFHSSENLSMPVVPPGGIVVPIALGERTTGAIVVGPKRSGDPYYEEDRELLETFASQAAVALEKARLFEKVRTHAAELEARVHERTEELERLQEEQRQMMVDISHGLQTPLAVAKSELYFMKGHPDAQKHAETFERSIDGISKFIYDLLALSRLDARRADTPAERVDLSATLAALAEYFGVMAEEQGIRLSAEIEPGVSMQGSRAEIEELVMNLVSNAFKYLDPSREKYVALRLRRAAGRAIIEVADNGRGIASEDMKNIFRRFYRGAGRTAPDSPRGTGLGLAIAKRIAEKHRGKISLASTLGQGTTVAVDLPALEDYEA